MKKDKTTEEKILEAARQVFIQKGLSGSRMQEIADKAGINKALLHYYFRSKDKLFAAIFSEALKTLLPQVQEILSSDLPLFEKIEKFVAYYIDTLLANSNIPVFVLNELSQHPDKFVKEVFGEIRPNPAPFIKQIAEEVNAGRIRPIHPMQLIMNMMSLCIFPFIGRPMFIQVFGLPNEAYNAMLEARKKDIPQFIIQSLKP